MDYVIYKELLHEVCIISTKNQYLVGRISKILADKFAVTIYPFGKSQQSIEESKVDIRIEPLGSNIYYYEATIDSQHFLNSHLILFLKPTKLLQENNRRKHNRLKINTRLSSLSIQFRSFPPTNLRWKKGNMIDISAGGIQLSAKDFFSRGDLIELKLGSPFFQVIENVIARIVNVKKTANHQYYLSIQFMNLSEENQEVIHQYIEKVQEIYNNLPSKKSL